MAPHCRKINPQISQKSILPDEVSQIVFFACMIQSVHILELIFLEVGWGGKACNKA